MKTDFIIGIINLIATVLVVMFMDMNEASSGIVLILFLAFTTLIGFDIARRRINQAVKQRWSDYLASMEHFKLYLKKYGA